MTRVPGVRCSKSLQNGGERGERYAVWSLLAHQFLPSGAHLAADGCAYAGCTQGTPYEQQSRSAEIVSCSSSDGRKFHAPIY